MKQPQLLTISIALLLVAGIYFFGRTVPTRKPPVQSTAKTEVQPRETATVNIDSILLLAKRQLTADQLVKINELEHGISRGDVKDQQIRAFRQLAAFWKDSARIFEPYAWYLGEAARLENSEKSLNFAARLFLENLQGEEMLDRKRWKALQAKDLFERSLRLNPNDDSAKVGLGACYLFGEISETPMEGILKIREVAERDTNNMYAQLMLGKASLLSGQFDKAISRLETVSRHEPGNLDAVLLLAEVYERMGDKKGAIVWYEHSLHLVSQADLKKAIADRIAELKK